MAQLTFVTCSYGEPFPRLLLAHCQRNHTRTRIRMHQQINSSFRFLRRHARDTDGRAIVDLVYFALAHRRRIRPIYWGEGAPLSFPGSFCYFSTGPRRFWWGSVNDQWFHLLLFSTRTRSWLVWGPRVSRVLFLSVVSRRSSPSCAQGFRRRRRSHAASLAFFRTPETVQTRINNKTNEGSIRVQRNHKIKLNQTVEKY